MKNIDKTNTLYTMCTQSQQVVDNKEEIRVCSVSPYPTDRYTPPLGGGATLARMARLMRTWWAGLSNAMRPPKSSPLARFWSTKHFPMPATIEHRITYPMVTFKSLENKKKIGACCARVAGTPIESRPN